MKKNVTPENSPYALDLSAIDTTQFANQNIYVKFSGSVVVNMPAQSSIDGSPRIYFIPTDGDDECVVNLVEGDYWAINNGEKQNSFGVQGMPTVATPTVDGAWACVGNK